MIVKIRTVLYRQNVNYIWTINRKISANFQEAQLSSNWMTKRVYHPVGWNDKTQPQQCPTLNTSQASRWWQRDNWTFPAHKAWGRSGSINMQSEHLPYINNTTCEALRIVTNDKTQCVMSANQLITITIAWLTCCAVNIPVQVTSSPRPSGMATPANQCHQVNSHNMYRYQCVFHFIILAETLNLELSWR